MLLPTRLIWATALACSLMLLGCEDDPKPGPTSDAGTDAGTDAGIAEEPWDGGYTVLEEVGDLNTDPGVLAPCTFLPQIGTRPDICPEPAQFDLSACNLASLGAVPDDGKYQLLMREEIPLEDGGTSGTAYTAVITLRSDGGPDTLNGLPFQAKVKDAQTLQLLKEGLTADGGQNRHLFVGCQATTPDRFVGCWGRCVNGRVRASATFEAHHMMWSNQSSEPESSGGLDFVSESHVAHRWPVDVYVAKDHAYVVSINFDDLPGKTGGLTVFDVKDRRNPVHKKSISLPTDNYWNGAWAKGNALYIASKDSGVIVFDISNPADPVLLRSVPGGPPLDVHTVLVDGDRLYGMAPAPTPQTLVFDISNPLEPILRQRIQLPLIGPYDAPHDAFAYGGRLYVNHTSGGYHVVDTTHLDDVKLLGTYAYEYSTSHHNAVGTFAGRTIAFEGGEGPGTYLRILDVTDPARIVKIGEYKKRPVSSIHNMLLVGSRLYVAWYNEGVRVLDVSNPTKPREVAHFNTFRETEPERLNDPYEGATGIRVPGDGYVYVVDAARGLLILRQP